MRVPLILAFVSSICIYAPSRGDYSITTVAEVADGQGDCSGLTSDSQGNLYGTSAQDINSQTSSGLVFEIANNANHTYTLLKSFKGTGGAVPYGGVVLDAQGNIYGTTLSGGPGGGGFVYEIANDSQRTFSIIANTNGGTYGKLAIDSNGNIFGTTQAGGTNNSSGTLFEIANDGRHTLTTLVEFAVSNGSTPYGGLTIDSHGNVVGTTYFGGAFGGGTVFRYNVGTSTLQTLASFSSAGDNINLPYGGVAIDQQGNIYGTAQTSGSGGLSARGGVFEIVNDSNHTLLTLARFGPFQNLTTGYEPQGDLTIDSSGNLFGTNRMGGPGAQGTVFEVANDPQHTFSIVSAFSTSDAAGYQPYGGVLVNSNGSIYGTTTVGPHNTNAVYELSPTAVPEPASAVLLAGMIGMVVAWRLNRGRHSAL